VLLRSAWGEEPKTKAAKERSSTALRFASFPVPKGICRLFLLDGADALIDGQLCRLYGHVITNGLSQVPSWTRELLSLQYAVERGLVG